MKNYQEFKKLVEEKEKSYTFGSNPSEYLKEFDYLACEDIDQVRDYLESLNSNNEITNEEIIYYSDAMTLLSMSDSDLRTSIALACELGYTIDHINSSLLASLLKTQMNEQGWSDFIEEVMAAME